MPGIFIGISFLFDQDEKAYEALGSIIVIFTALALGKLVYWVKKQDGKAKFMAWLEKRQFNYETMTTLPEDMKALKEGLAALEAHTGLKSEE